ncbi:hypothetical protein P7F88_11145 [Vibrio hannami]|nr:hypothetical protein [Vibrio hannami]MDG3086635.1 hypothetical protein [Vibrio hannami]
MSAATQPRAYFFSSPHSRVSLEIRRSTYEADTGTLFISPAQTEDLSDMVNFMGDQVP